MKWTAISLVILTALVWIGLLLSSGPLRSILAVMVIILTVLAIPTAWTVVTVYTNKWKAEGRKGLINLSKTIVPLLLVSVIILLVFSESGSPLRILASMVIGAIVFPTAIWLIMSLSIRWGEKSA
ncbi:hypothetical protein [Bacillus sp. JCM 19041]|uniref:hypothetical protein n=1 Tax=Bacillus sp. JCM 19041 TaxID=1460637 RepID=UPI000A749482